MSGPNRSGPSNRLPAPPCFLGSAAPDAQFLSNRSLALSDPPHNLRRHPSMTKLDMRDRTLEQRHCETRDRSRIRPSVPRTIGTPTKQETGMGEYAFLVV